MSIQDYIEKMKNIHRNLLCFLDESHDEEEHYQNLIQILKDQKISENRHELKTLLYMLSKISNHHCRENHLFEKIEKIYKIFENDIKEKFTNYEIFKISKGNKKLLQFLFDENILTIDEMIENDLIKTKKKLSDFFIFLFPEKSLKLGLIQELDDDFHSKRKIGENDDLICELIRQDSIEQFIIYIEQNDISIDSIINHSIFETNAFLLKQKETTLIEYASFFGSSQIFKYLQKNKATINPIKIWLYAIHGNDEEIIQILKENKNLKENNNQPPFYSYECIKESVKCHNDNMLNYLKNNYNIDVIDESIFSYCFQYYNFLYFPKEIDNIYYFYYACKYDHYTIVEYFLKTKSIDIKAKIISKKIFSFLNTIQKKFFVRK